MTTARHLAAALCAAFASVTAASASSYSFKVADYELSTPQAREVTMKRIVRVAEGVCDVDTARALYERSAAVACADKVVADIVAEIDHPQLTAMHENHLRTASR